jgi:hypothetical protein
MNKRHEDRPRLMTYLEVRCADTGQTVGRIVDLTTRGMRLVTDGPLELEAEFHLVIPMDDSAVRHEDLRIDARCVWIGHDVNPELHCAGFEFEHVRPRQQSLLARIIHRHRFEFQAS